MNSSTLIRPYILFDFKLFDTDGKFFNFFFEKLILIKSANHKKHAKFPNIQLTVNFLNIYLKLWTNLIFFYVFHIDFGDFFFIINFRKICLGKNVR